MPDTVPATTVAPISADADSSVMLIGIMVFIMGIFYLVNALPSVITDNTWSMLSQAVSIFIAVLTNDIVTTCIVSAFSINTDTPTTGGIVAAGVQWVVFWLVVTFAFFCFKGNILHLKGYGTVAGHLLGFAGINFFGLICLSQPWSSSPWLILSVYGIYTVSFIVLFGIGFLFRFILTSCIAVSAEDNDRWHDQTADTGTDFFCMTGSWILSFFIRFLIINPSVPSIDGSTDGRGTDDVLALLSVGFALLLFAGVVAIFATCVSTVVLNNSVVDMGHGSSSTLMNVLTTKVSLTSAWCFLFAADWWAFLAFGASVMTRTTVAEIFSFIAFCFVLLMWGTSFCPCNVDKFMGALFGGISLTVGMGWEKTFDACMDGMGAYMAGTTGPSTLAKTIIQTIFLFIAFPAWCAYILPKADDELKKLPRQPFWIPCPGFSLLTKEQEEKNALLANKQSPQYSA